MDIVILRVKYPNDPTGNISPHQHFISLLNDDKLEIYSVSSVAGKERRVFGSKREDYEIITAGEIGDCDFKVPSFVDCSKCYSILIDETIDIEKLSHWDIADYISERIRNRIKRKIAEDSHTIYQISLEDLKQWNEKLRD